MVESTGNENLSRSESIRVKEIFHPFDSRQTLWESPSTLVSDSDLQSAHSDEDFDAIIEKLKPENKQKWGARNSIQLDISSAPGVQELLTQYGRDNFSPLTFRFTAFSGSAPSRRHTITPFTPEAGHIPNTLDQDEDAQAFLIDLNPAGAVLEKVDVSKAPLLFEVAFVPSEKLSRIGLLQGDMQQITFSPEFEKWLSNLRLEIHCQTTQGPRMYVATPQSYLSLGKLEYINTFLAEGKPTVNVLSEGFMIALPGDKQVLDEGISARFTWQETQP